MSINIGHFILFMGNNGDIYSVLLHGRNFPSFPSLQKDDSCRGKNEAFYWLSFLVNYQFSCRCEVHSMHPNLEAVDWEWLSSKESSTSNVCKSVWSLHWYLRNSEIVGMIFLRNLGILGMIFQLPFSDYNFLLSSKQKNTNWIVSKQHKDCDLLIL